MQKKLIRMASLWLVLCVCVALISVGAAVEPMDMNRKGSISITLREHSGTNSVLIDTSFCLHKVGDAQMADGSLTFVPTEDFAESGISIADLQEKNLAVHLAAFAVQKGISNAVGAADADGVTTFADLDTGLYLITQDKAAAGYYPAAPFLVSIPMADPESDGWIYQVDASPKVEVKPSTPSEQYTKRTVKKIWEGNHDAPPASVTAALLQDGAVFDTVTLTAENNWQYAWEQLDADHVWQVVEVNVPKDYTVSYEESGTSVQITNTFKPNIPDTPEEGELSVVKIWDKDKGVKRPESVQITLYRDGKPYDTVTLSEKNGWSAKWSKLSGKSEWSVRENDVPDGYRVSYQVEGNVFKVVNTYDKTLIQTGQLNWPIPILAGTGVLLFMAGWFLTFGKRKADA